MAAVTDDRLAKIDEYVVRDAFATVLANLTNSAIGAPVLDEFDGVDMGAVSLELLAGLDKELWPVLPEPLPDEFEEATRRGLALAAHIFASLAARPEILCRHAAYFAALAAGTCGPFGLQRSE